MSSVASVDPKATPACQIENRPTSTPNEPGADLGAQDL
jgi:hypothetical protein